VRVHVSGVTSLSWLFRAVLRCVFDPYLMMTIPVTAWVAVTTLAADRLVLVVAPTLRMAVQLTGSAGR
jgi:hypothetical protein